MLSERELHSTITHLSELYPDYTIQQFDDSIAILDFDIVVDTSNCYSLESAVNLVKETISSQLRAEAYLAAEETTNKPIELVSPPIVNDGSSADYYDLPPGARDIQDIIELRNFNWNRANILKAIYRMGSQDHSSVERDLNKIKYFVDRELNRISYD